MADGSPRVSSGEALQRAADRSPQTQGAVQMQATADRSSTVSSLASRMQRMSGIDLSDVRVHYDSPKPRELQAHAFTKGPDIYLGPGQQQHLAHEMWHAVQQKQGRVAATRQLKGESINDSDALEREADVMGARALSRTDNQLPQQQDVSRGSGQSPVVQGKFGLEVELDVNLSNTATPTPDVYTEPICEHTPIIALGDDFQVHKDHNSNLAGVGRGYSRSGPTSNFSIVELTTDPPLDETESWETVRAKADKMLAAINWMGRGGFGVAKSLAGMPGFRGMRLRGGGIAYVGGPVVRGTQSTHGHVQITAGVNFARIIDFFKTLDFYHAVGHTGVEAGRAVEARGPKQVKRAEQTQGNQPFEFMRTRQAIPFAESVAAEMIADPQGRRELAGLLALATRYMLHYRHKEKGVLAKNNVGAYFYKSELTDFRNHVTSDELKACLDDATQVQAIIDSLFAKLGSKSRPTDPSPVPPAYLGEPTDDNETWMRKVLMGTGPDDALLRMKNPYSNVIPIEKSGGDGPPLFVLENRFPQRYMDGSLEFTTTQQIMDLVSFYYTILREYNVPTRVEDDTDV